MLSLRDLTEVLIKHYGHHEGKFEALISFDVGVGPFIKPGNSGPAPTVFMSIAGMQLSRVVDGQPSNNPDGILDAAVVNPLP
jgi:hypothetical protein